MLQMPYRKESQNNIMEILQVNNLCKTYGKGETQVNALRNVSFSLEKGAFCAVIGEYSRVQEHAFKLHRRT